ncbi:PREDICTED: protein ENHANCED DOWNY MILDEW 2 isoform X2 [Theobroma cacao]|uniref:Protein ENHANCED DOWNY MILDEW 2 isoform X2 n=1 Tax=Theobroma cacao TaxID=3641 RepID=A0AB32WRL7_THECC|nr:PREDICTED: protein ENHANCED DOWNY MILDEW 2 isoform X2 [Theobroma cacao]
MAFSDEEEEESLLRSVSNYYFDDEKDEKVSFSELPLQLGGKESLINGAIKKLLLRGTADDGLLTICKLVTAWKFDLSNFGKPEILVLSKENGWIKLQKPRKSFEPVIRSVLITVHCLHLLSWNPDLSRKSLWDQLAKAFSLYEVKPSQNDLVDHRELICEAVKSTASLAKSKFLHTFLEEKPIKRKLADEDVRATSISGFIVDDADDAVDGPEQDDSNDEDDELFDSVCAFCDNGGELLCCDGKCLRSFHATVEAGEESFCESLGFTQKQVEAMQTFSCKNCEYNKHQCFACGKLGSSDKSSGAEVFRCSNATCGHFYHPHCVAKLLHKGDKVAAEEHGQKISAGEFFTCPIHKCCVCQQGENKKVQDLQFALCRRCPTSYHRKCLPREIGFDDIDEEGIVTRAWDGLLVNRVLIYCLKHKINDEIGTPERDHIKFPIVEDRKIAFDERKKRKASDLPTSHEKVGLKKKSFALEDSSWERTAMKAEKQSSSIVKDGQTSKKSEKVTPGTNSHRKVKAPGSSIKPLKGKLNSVPMKVGKSSATDQNRTSLGDKLFAFMTQSEQVKPGRQDMLKGGNKTAVVKSTAKKMSSGMPSLDADSERRLFALMKEVESSITLEDIIAKHKVPSTHAYSSKSVVDRTITLGKIEGSVDAVRMALAKLEDGCNIEDAQAVCEPEVLNQIFKWQNKLRVYLAPFLNGMRYTSFGRHFTKVDKLKEIVDRLHWYVQDGDTIVDFCCGANDFSLLMKRKLEETGKKCSYKNYDIFQAKNDFNFEKRDWMTVRPKELPRGSQLIMGLNPPFGVKAGLANKFINKALEFNPKLLILIVPPETERLDKKKLLKSSYELVWEDNQFLSGKSFYLPGSVDTNDKQMDQWNVMAPPLYLWSRSDFSAMHKTVAEKHGHLPREPESSNQERNIDETHISEQPLEDDSHCNDASELKDHMQNHKVEERREETSVTVTPKECSPHQQCEREGQDNHGHVKKQSKEPLRKKKHRGRNRGRRTDGKSPLDKQSGVRTPISEMHRGIPHSSPSNVMGGRYSVEGVSKSHRTAPLTGIGEKVHRHHTPTMHGSQVQVGTSYGDTRTSVADDMGRRYSINNTDPYPVGSHNLGHGPYATEVEREANIRSKVRLYGQDPDVSTQRNYPAGLDSAYGPAVSLSTPSYVHLGATVDPSYRMNTSAMQRYAPRLDELNYTRFATPGPEPPMGNHTRMATPGPEPFMGNHTRMATPGPEPFMGNHTRMATPGPEPPMGNHTRMGTPGPEPRMGTQNAFYDPRGPSFYDLRGPPVPDPRATRPSHPMAFAPGPYHPYSHQNSAGWLHE